MDHKEESDSRDPFADTRKAPRSKSNHRYSKEELLDIKELPHSKQRPSCLADKYDSDGVWDPEKWHASLYPNSGRSSPIDCLRKESDTERTSLKRRIADPRERVKEDDLDVVLSPQRRSFGGGCHVTAAVGSRRAGSPLDNKENESLRLAGGRRIGSGRIIAARGFDRDLRGGEKDGREPRDGRDREKEYKDKRFRREYGDSKRVFGERRRNDSYTEEEPEWFSGGPTSQSETIELTGFDDKILEEDQKGRKRTRKRATSVKEGFECNGGVLEEEATLPPEPTADQEVPREAILPEAAPGDFDFNEFFNLDKSVPGLASMIEDVLGEGSVSASRFSRWFSNHSHSGSRSSSLRSTPHEELERLAGLEQVIPSLGQNSANYFAPIQFEDTADKVDILEMLQKAKVDLKPLLSSLTANKEKLRESTHSGVALSVEEVEAGLKGLKVEQEGKIATPFMAEQLEGALTAMAGPRKQPKDGDMSAFNKLVSSMKASGTLPNQPKVNRNLDGHLMSSSDVTGPSTLQRNILQELLGPPISDPSSNVMGSLDPTAALLRQRTPSPQIPPVFPTRAASADYLRTRIPSPLGFPSSHQLLGDQFPAGVPKADSPVMAQVSPLEMQQAVLEGLVPHDLAFSAAGYYPSVYGKMQMDKGRDGFRNRPPQRMNKSPVSNMRGSSVSPGPGAPVTSMLSPSFTPTSVIRKMYESKEKNKDEISSGKQNSHGKEERRLHEDGSSHISDNAVHGTSPVLGNRFPTSQRSGCTPPLPHHSRYTKDQEYRPKSSGRQTPTMASPVPGASFLRPLHQVPVVPVVRPSHQLHPGLVQKMLAQGLPPQQLSLLQAGLLPPGMDLPALHSLPPAVLGQQFYPLSQTGHPLLNQRQTNPLQLAMMHRSGSGTQNFSGLHASSQGLQNRPNLHMGDQRPPRSSSPVGLAKWFGSDVLQQPLPSMPAKVISVDELEYRQ
ncbi:eukaryotic translation initiation factor 4E transporter isoform X2 [Dendropsophus ebraccatus]|uniref:eukaryotic translation initiation factor 4E transporter isoform X2 n=1 Tax=Dendropsophus ebraccatus TaxID=150705 RepID=UPI003831CD18